jgi:hypothetical protein
MRHGCCDIRGRAGAEISAGIYRTGAQALAITALVGFLVGIVLSYLSAQQLKTFGADIFIINLLGVSIIRELGPVLAAVLVAGRSGSSMTAQLGVMRVTEELDAMTVMGIPHTVRLILPKVIALAISMPLVSRGRRGRADRRRSPRSGARHSLQPVPAALSPKRCRSPTCGWDSARASCSACQIALIACHCGCA